MSENEEDVDLKDLPNSVPESNDTKGVTYNRKVSNHSLSDHKTTAPLIRMNTFAMEKGNRIHQLIWLNDLNGLKSEWETAESKDVFSEPNDDGRTPFHLACLHSNAEIILFFLEELILVIDINAKDRGGLSPLHILANSNSAVEDLKTIVEACVAKGAVLTAQDGDKRTPIFIASEKGNVAMVKAILMIDQSCEFVKNKFGETPLSVAAKNGHLDICEALISNNDLGKHKRYRLYELVVRDENSQTPLHKASIGGHLAIVKLLLETARKRCGMFAERDYINIQDSDKNSALLYSISEGHKDLFALLLRSGSKRHDIDANNIHPLHLVSTRGNRECLIECAKFYDEFDVLDYQSQSPLHYAAINNQLFSIEFFAEKKCDVNRQDNAGKTPILLAAEHGHIEAIRTLLAFGAHLNDADQEGHTILHLCASNNYLLLFQMLTTDYLGEIKLLLNIADRTGNIPLHYAASKDCAEMAMSMMENGAEPSSYNTASDTALCIASARGHVNVLRSILQVNAHLISDRDAESNTPLHLCCKHGHYNVVSELLDRGASLEDVNVNESTPLFTAAKRGKLRCCAKLISQGADINVQCIKDETPLHVAAEFGHAKVVQLLLNKGALITKNSDDQNALDVAIEYDRESTALIIVKSDYWKDALRNVCRTKDGVPVTPFRKLIEKYPRIAEIVLDRSIEPSQDKEPNKYVLNFEFIEDSYPKNLIVEEGSKGSKFEQMMADKIVFLSGNGIDINHPVIWMTNCKRLNLLNHIVCKSFIDYKWNALAQYIYISNLVLFFCYLSTVTAYALDILKASTNKGTSEPCTESSTNSCFRDTCQDFHSYFNLPLLRGFVIFGIVISLAKEFLQLFQMRSKYINLKNLMEVSGPLCACFFISVQPCEVRETAYWQVGALAIFIGWMDMILKIRKSRFFGVYIVMFTTVLTSFMKLFIVLALALLAFSFTFSMVLGENSKFHDFPRTFMKTAFMMVGEFTFDEIVTPEDSARKGGIKLWSQYIVLISFLVIMSVLTMNLLVGIAVDDIKVVLNDANLERLAMKAQLVIELESLIPRFIKRKSFFRKRLVISSMTVIQKAGLPIFSSSNLNSTSDVLSPEHLDKTQMDTILKAIKDLQNEIMMMKGK